METHVSQLSERLVERGHDVTVLTADAGPNATRRVTRNGVEVRRHRALSPGGAIHIAPGIWRAVRHASADIVHAHNYHSTPLMFAALAVNGPLVASPHYHSLSSHRVLDWLLSLYSYPGGWTLRRTDAVIAVSEWERDKLERDFGVGATVVPNGIDTEAFTDVSPLERQRPYLLCAGRLEEYKGVQHAVRALQELPAFDLLVAGSGPYYDEIKTVARDCGVGQRVSLLGHVTDQRLRELYAGAEVFLNLSSFEAYGITVAEALASGTPVVIRTGSALDQWLANPGVVGVDTVTVNEVVSGVEQARQQSPDSTGIVDWNVVVDKHLKVYHSFL